MKEKKTKLVFCFMLISVAILTGIALFLFVVNRWTVTVVLKGDENVILEYEDEYEEKGAEAKLQGSLVFKNGFSIETVTNQNGDLSKLGDTIISYSANIFGLSDTVERVVSVVDTTPPEIHLITIEGSFTIPGNTYEEEGFAATDNYDGNLTDKVIREESEEMIIYTVTDSSGNTTKVTRSIVYEDPIAPELTLKGDEKITLLVGTEYEEIGYTAIDNCDGDITENVIITGEVNKDLIGEYTLIYTIKDSYGNEDVATRTICYEDTKKPDITLVSGNELVVEIGSVYTDPGYTANDNYDGDITSQVLVSGTVDPNTIGDYYVTYEVTDANGNTATVIRNVYVRDTIAPQIVLNGEAKIVIQVGGVYTEPGYTANDNYDGDVTSSVLVNGTVNMNVPGTYVLTYSVSDTNGNTSSVQRVVVAYDPVPPTLMLEGSKNISINAGTSYTEPGYKASDNYDGDITSSVKVSGWVNIYHAGTYTLTYSVTDSSGNTVSDSRTVTVNAIRQPDVVTPSGKVIYLTFDDGPSKHTDKLLDVLAKYNVKATFFVVNTPYIDKIPNIVAAGHTVALHTFTHDYSKVYSSEEAYFEDLRQIQALVHEKTGIMSTMVRFPGGSSNRVSASYCKGIMTSLTKALTSMGYQYYDWNVDSKDAGGAKTAEEVFQNVINGVQKRDISIVLQHDTHEYSVDAVEKIIIWGLANGYTFMPLDETSPTAHQNVAN